MPAIYTDSLGTAGTLTTNASANTATETFFLKPASTRSIYLSTLYVGGQGAAATTLSSVTLRGLKWGTASTGGTALSSAPTDTSWQAATATNGSRPTAGTTRTNSGVFVNSGIATGNFWASENPDAMPSLAASSAASLSVEDLGTSASMVFMFWAQHREY